MSCHHCRLVGSVILHPCNCLHMCPLVFALFYLPLVCFFGLLLSLYLLCSLSVPLLCYYSPCRSSSPVHSVFRSGVVSVVCLNAYLFLKAGLTDPAPYVRKTAVIGCAKLYQLNSTLVLSMFNCFSFVSSLLSCSLCFFHYSVSPPRVVFSLSFMIPPLFRCALFCVNTSSVVLSGAGMVFKCV